MSNCLVSKRDSYRKIINFALLIFSSLTARLHLFLQVQGYTGSPNNASATPSPYIFAEDIEALSVVNPSPERAPSELLAAPDGGASQSQDGLGVHLSTAEVGDLGAALASMFATSPSPTPQRATTGTQFAASSSRRASDDVGSEQLHSLSPRVLVDETALLPPAYSPLSSSIASSSSLEDIASIVGEKSPQSSLTSQDIAQVSPASSSTARRKSSESSDSEEETAAVDGSKTNKVIKLPQSKKTIMQMHVNALL